MKSATIGAVLCTPELTDAVCSGHLAHELAGNEKLGAGIENVNQGILCGLYEEQAATSLNARGCPDSHSRYGTEFLITSQFMRQMTEQNSSVSSGCANAPLLSS